MPVGLLVGLGLSAAVFVTGRAAAGPAGRGGRRLRLAGRWSLRAAAGQRPEGDLVVPGTAAGYGLAARRDRSLVGACIVLPGPGAVRRR